ncbi:hypothetical protein [Xenorhabdus bovienii]|nr:hypothetical protein [Xenorhabdus bovienii]
MEKLWRGRKQAGSEALYRYRDLPIIVQSILTSLSGINICRR